MQAISKDRLKTPGIVVVGTSMGGLSALEVLLAGLPAGLPWPFAIVQHRSPDSEHIMVTLLQRYAAMCVSEPQDKEAVLPGHVYIAPPDYHLLVEPTGFALSTEAKVNHARPSIDVLFESAARTYGRNVVAVVLTGASKDGACGAVRVKESGGILVVQDPETAESPLMPRSAMLAVSPDAVLPMPDIASCLVQLLAEGEA